MSAYLPLDPGLVINRALQIYRDQIAVLLPAALVVFAIQAIVVVAFSNVLGVVVSVVSMVLSTFYQGMVVELVQDVQDGRRDQSVQGLFASVTPVLITLIAAAIVNGLGVAIGLVLLIVPGLFLLTIWSVVAPVIVIERTRLLEAFRRSHDLVRGNGGPVFVVILIVFVGLAVANFLVAVLTHGLGDGASAAITWLFNAATAPISALTAAVLYFTLRERAAR
ncbi:MAG TPA: hypothetical protein VFG42_13490 [Baekduia sp.]|uniref:hypothetical protein n=1 Tax=Baekduia sp. TaxID=2600305 RepID=UPI002D769B62|nr:hypothetical protein [Baekduia sp.]HET6507797.1 hypothetical protein [Baekduia sp.]